MRSIVGAGAALLYALAFGAAFYAYIRVDGAWPDGQWLFLVALPYTYFMVRWTGGVDFSGDAIATVITAALFCCAIAYIAGAVVEAIARMAFLGLRRLIGRA